MVSTHSNIFGPHSSIQFTISNTIYLISIHRISRSSDSILTFLCKLLFACDICIASTHAYAGNADIVSSELRKQVTAVDHINAQLVLNWSNIEFFYTQRNFVPVWPTNGIPIAMLSSYDKSCTLLTRKVSIPIIIMLRQDYRK